jgi:hypothetical protein
LLSTFLIEPFIFANCIFAPNAENLEDVGFLKKYARASIGYGFSMQFS